MFSAFFVHRPKFAFVISILMMLAGLLCISPYYVKTNEEGMYRHFADTADAVSIPCILYNVPGRTGMGISLPEEVITYLADNISANIREIEGAISSLVANTSFMGKKITISLAKEILKGYISLYQKEITIENIIDSVCNYMNIDRERLNSSERTREVAIARQLAMYLAKQLTKIPLSAIGAAIGNRNHATVLHSCRTITNLIDTDQAFKLQVEELEKIVSA